MLSHESESETLSRLDHIRCMDNAVFCSSRSPLAGCVGCFHILTDVNNGALRT